jgi:hypothetical protein
MSIALMEAIEVFQLLLLAAGVWWLFNLRHKLPPRRSLLDEDDEN